MKLENMNSFTFKKSILRFLSLKNSMAINTSTFAGIPWKSDKLSQFKKEMVVYTSVLQENWKDFYFKRFNNFKTFILKIRFVWISIKIKYYRKIS